MNNMARIISGTIIFVCLSVIWLLAAIRDIDTGALLAFGVPVIGALFLTGQIADARTAAQQAAQQTNGALDARIVAGAMHAASMRDAAKTMAITAAADSGRTFPQPPDIPAGEAEPQDEGVQSPQGAEPSR